MKFYIYSNGDTSYRIVPKPCGISQRAIRGPVGNSAQCYIESWLGHDDQKWQFNKPANIYYLDTTQYYDGGYKTRFPNAKSDIEGHILNAQNKIKATIPVNFANSSVTQINSHADSCGTSVTTPCPHGVIQHKNKENVALKILTAGNDTHTVYLWSGHMMTPDSQCMHWANWLVGNKVLMLPGDYTDSNGVIDVTPTELRDFQRSAYVHETSHAFGAKDHYCYDDGSPCSNQNCWKCAKKLPLSAKPLCWMTSPNSFPFYCDECITIIYKHLSNHHKI